MDDDVYRSIMILDTSLEYLLLDLSSLGFAFSHKKYPRQSARRRLTAWRPGGGTVQGVGRYSDGLPQDSVW